MIIKIDGEAVDYKDNSLDIDDAIGERSTAFFTVVDRQGNKRYKKGQPVEIFENDGISKVFGGVIDKPVSKYFSEATTGKFHNISCTDWHYIGDKRIVAKLYTNQTAGAIVRDILNNYLAAEGVTEGVIQDGPNVTEAVFNYVNATQCLEGLAELAGFEFYFDGDKALHFLHRATYYNSRSITETSDIKNVEVEPAAEEYRNKQYIRAGMDTTDVQTETFKGDGTLRSFVVSYPISKVPTVKINGATQTVGIKGVETGKQWYWNKGENVISQDDSGAVLTSSQTLTVQYQGLFDIVAVSYATDEIDRMKSVEGGTGVHEHVEDEPYLTSREAAFESASAKLKRFASVGTRITFDTKITGLRSGHLIHIKLDSYGIDDYFLIESVKAAELGTQDGRLIYTITLVDGAATGGWTKFFKKMATRGQAFVLRENIKENEVLATLEQFSKNWTESERPNIFAELYPSATLYPSTTLYPVFNEGDKVKYLVLYDGTGTELFRKAITKKVVEPGKIVSTTYIAPFEADHVQIAEVGWVGGVSASKNTGSGILIDKQPYNKLKTELESVQIDKTDIKGW